MIKRKQIFKICEMPGRQSLAPVFVRKFRSVRKKRQRQRDNVPYDKGRPWIYQAAYVSLRSSDGSEKLF